jgi:glucokinase
VIWRESVSPAPVASIEVTGAFCCDIIGHPNVYTEGDMAKGAGDKPVVGTDLGGTKILAGVVDQNGKILGMAKRPTKADEGVEEVVSRISKTILDAVSDAKLDKSDIAAVCVVAPGPCNPEQGIVWSAPNLPGWEEVHLPELIKARLDLPVFLENDVNLGTFGEFVLGAGKGYQDLVGIFVGTGIGGGLVLDGKLRQGFRCSAAEIGHMVILADGPVCGCGKRGCAEALASRTAIERDIWAGIKAGRESLIPEIMKRERRVQIPSGALAEAYRAGDPLVTEVLSKAQFYLGILVATCVNLIDPEAVILGGGVVEALGGEFLEPIRRVAYQYFMNQRDARRVNILQAKLGDNAALLGAAMFARQKVAAK